MLLGNRMLQASRKLAHSATTVWWVIDSTVRRPAALKTLECNFPSTAETKALDADKCIF